MCTIKLQEILNGRDYPDSGSILYDKMLALEKTCDKVVLDMDGVISLPTIFLNVSIGKYITNSGLDSFKAKYSFAHISVSQVERLQKYIKAMSSTSTN